MSYTRMQQFFIDSFSPFVSDIKTKSFIASAWAALPLPRTCVFLIGFLRYTVAGDQNLPKMDMLNTH